MKPRMAHSTAYSEADDAALVAGCVGGDGDAWAALLDRYGRLLRSIVVRVLDERRLGQLDEAPAAFEVVIDHFKKGGGSALRAWDSSCGLRPYLAIVTRLVAESYVQDATRPATNIGLLPSEPAESDSPSKLTELLDRLPPNLRALVRLRLRGLDRADVSAILGIPQQQVAPTLEKIAERFGETEGANALAAWRIVLDCAPPAERVAIALRTEEDGSLRAAREAAEQSWRAVRDVGWLRPQPRTASCLDDKMIAAFIDGSLRGPGRARTEGHLATCERCVDAVASLTNDLRAVGPLKDAASADESVALAAACIATGRHRAAEHIARGGVQAGAERARALLRLARVGRAIDGDALELDSAETSRVVSRIPTDDEAPLVALEALAAGDPHAAERAIDDHAAKQTLGLRLRLIAAAAGNDVDAAKALANELAERSHDPGLAADAEATRSLPADRSLPREVLLERLRDVLPLALRRELTR